MNIPDVVRARFWAKVQKTPTCWIWTAHRDYKGYGQFRSKHIGGFWFAHRLSWIINHGEIMDDSWVLHKCDNPACVNPDHLYLGTSDDNIADMIIRGRVATGERHSQAKLSNEKVLEIRRLFGSGITNYVRLGEMFGVSRSTIGDVVNRQTWTRI